jgi:hypothetical protein
MKIALKVNKVWYYLLETGRLTYDYRRCTDYYKQRILNKDLTIKQFNIVEFQNGYSKDCKKLLFECKEISIVGDNFIFKLGKKL